MSKVAVNCRTENECASRTSAEVDRAELRNAWVRAKAAFPGVSLDEDSFATHVGRALGRITDGASVSELVFDDLYIACACLLRAWGATQDFLRRYRGVIRSTIQRTLSSPDCDEVLQSVFADLLVGSATRPPEIGDYAGRAPLARWLEVVARRTAVRWQRAERTRANVAARAGLEPLPEQAQPPDAALFRERYRGDFERSLNEAIWRATEHDRLVLGLRYVDGMGMEKMAALFGVSQSTASRWLAKARRGVLADLKNGLKHRCRLSSVEIQSLAELMSCRLDVSALRALATAQAVPNRGAGPDVDPASEVRGAVPASGGGIE